ncbi:MAG: efflux RND transporter periplasmic adaptor subunit [Planctomycetota bacterium]|nr:efflux RND transporter periplasmic adaptor subunit [Planctomycetota bacterium]
MKKLIALVVILGIAGGGYYYWEKGKVPEEQSAPKEATAVVERGGIVLSVSATGKVVANLEVAIKCKASGEIVKLPFDVSDEVKMGDLLVELDPVDEQRAVRQAEEALAASIARLEQARQNLKIAEESLKTEKRKAETALSAAMVRWQDACAKFERVKQLLEKNLTSKEEYETVQTSVVQAAADLEAAKIRMEELKVQEMSLELKRQDVILAETQVESNKISLSVAEQRLKDTKVYAPIDGTVSERNVQKGQIISSGISNVGGGTTVMVLSDLSRIFVLAAVDESDIGKVRIGQPVKITVDAFPMKRFRGEVVRIATKGVTVSNVVTFEVKIEVMDKEKSLLKPEMTANVEILIDEKKNVLLVPIDAVVRKDGKRMVTVMKEDKSKEERAVLVGISDGIKIEVSEGLKEGETVVVQRSEADSKWRSGQGMPRPPFMFGGSGRRR